MHLALSHEYRGPSRPELAGGDVFAFVRHQDDGATLLVADLSAKGADGIRFAECLANAFHLACATLTLPSRILKHLNVTLGRLFGDPERGLFATALLCRFSVSESYCMYSSAGAELPILWKGTHFYQTLPVDPGIVLGVDAGAVYRDFVTPIAPNDTIVAFTDGVSESKRLDDGTRLGPSGVIEAIAATHDRGAHIDGCEVLAEIDRLNGRSYHDDATLFVASMSTSLCSHNA